MKNLSVVSKKTLLASALTVILGLLPVSAAFGQGASQPLWRDIDERSLAPGNTRLIAPAVYRTVRLDESALRGVLAKVPMEFSEAAQNAPVEMTIPLPDGKLSRFKVVESPMMEPELAALVPGIKTYSGSGLDDKTATIRFDLTRTGFHGIILATEGTIFIDPYALNDAVHYISYYKRDFQETVRIFDCLTTDAKGTGVDASSIKSPAVSNAGTLRIYRLALAATGQYTNRFRMAGDTDADAKLRAFAALMTTMNRVNLIYERDLSIRMSFIGSELDLIYPDPTNDPYDANDNATDNTNAIGAQNQTHLDNPGVVGFQNYEIGHVIGAGTGQNRGNAGGIGTICGVKKGSAFTILGAGPPGHPFDVDFVAHEMGHQWGANHTFNGQAGACTSDGRADSAAYEPGSGVTIMGYGGICGNQNLAAHSLDNFHVKSLEEILLYIRSGNGSACASPTPNGNRAPSVTAPGPFKIPKRTPFSLTASATDPDGDSITYDWQEYDLGDSTAAVPNTDADGEPRPIFRPYSPTAREMRTFPSLEYILNNASVPPATTGEFLTGELLPAISRVMTFQVVARDNRSSGGGIDAATSVVTIDGVSGPFSLTAPNTGITAPALSNLAVTWNVAGTAAPPIGALNVKISLSTDGGFTFPLVLAASTPNDGVQSVLIPNTPTTTARVKVEAVGNIFFDISDTNFTISPADNGKIAFVRLENNDNWEIYTMDPDGSNQTRLTSTPEVDDHPAWSPDGLKIAFASARDGNGEIYVMDADGSNPTRLTHESGNYSEPAWSPDGAKIAFSGVRLHKDGYETREIYVMDATGSTPVNLTNSLNTDASAAWSPDGRKIAYISSLDDGRFAIFVMDANGSNKRRLNTQGQDPAWSPDGAKIAFSGGLHTSEICVMNADGTNQTCLTNDNLSPGEPAWSPDGKKITFRRALGEGEFEYDPLEIYVMNADGTNQTRLTNNQVLDYFPIWQPVIATPTPTPTPTPTSAPNTAPGHNVVIQSPSGDETVGFAQVTIGGTTTFTSIAPGSVGQFPAGYQLSAESRAFDITTTATVSGPISVSFYFPSVINPAIFASLRILHGENGALVDRTFQHDFATKMIRARVDSLSPFFVAQSTATPKRLLNISTRLRVETGDNALIAGFIITGTERKQVIIRGIGPSLSGFGVPDALQNTTLQLYEGGTLLAENDNWKDAQRAEIEATGIPPNNDLEAAIVRTLSPGAYTAILRGKDHATGIGLVEAYDLSPAANTKLANISTRGFVATGDTVLIAGFIVGSSSATPAAVVVRAIGPSLSGAGVFGALENPTLELYNGSGTVVGSNDSWRATQQTEILAMGIPPNDDRESAIVATLASGNYTAIVRGVGNTIGAGLVEVYNVQ